LTVTDAVGHQSSDEVTVRVTRTGSVKEQSRSGSSSSDSGGCTVASTGGAWWMILMMSAAWLLLRRGSVLARGAGKKS
jgi:hypothetical protein